MSEEFIDQVLAQVAARHAQGPALQPGRAPLVWHTLEEGDNGLLRAARLPEGGVLVQNLHLDAKHTMQFWVPPAAFPTLRALLGPAPATEGSL
jgi:hypothetical protein